MINSSDSPQSWSPIVYANGGLVALDVLHHPAVRADPLAHLVEIVLGGAIGVVALLAHGALPSVVVAASFPLGSDKLG